MLVIRRLVSICSAGLMLISGAALAQSYPSKPVRIITAGTGGGNDLTARILAPGLSAQMGQSFVVENRPTAGLPEAVAKAPPDGYTLMVYSGGLWLRPFMADVTYDPVRDFVPITWAMKSPLAIVVHPSLPVNSVKELIALAKAKPGTLNYSTGGTGSSTHLAPELFKQITGTDMVRVPYKSGAQELADLVGGRVQLSFNGGGTVSGQVKAGKLRALAVTSDGPSELFPGLPTVSSQGVPGYTATQMFGMLGPARLPDAIVRRLSQESVKYLQLESTKQQTLAGGQEVVGSTPEEFAAAIKADMARWGKLIKDAGIREE